jgi:2',3'-cyclic-nucleotide 2'-phosphodiesterase/3'-nucleotidase
MEFIVATNNYRASGLKVAPSKKIVLAAPDENRQAIIDYIAQNETINPSADNNWKFAAIAGSTGVKVAFESSPNAEKYLQTGGNIKFVKALDSGFGQYELTLESKKEENKPQQPQKPTPKVYWDGALLKQGQIGRVTVSKPINLWKREGDKLVFVRVLKKGEVYRVYNYDGKHGGQYGLGGGYYITNMKGYIKYETPSKAKLKQLGGE